MTNKLTDAAISGLMDLLQKGVPLTHQPYLAIGAELDMEEEGVIRRIAELKEKGIVRKISPVLDARKIGYRSTLIAMKVQEKSIHKAEGILIMHPGISHAYEREHEYNVWFTMSVLRMMDIQSELEKLAAQIGAEYAFTLPAVRVFKLRTSFNLDEDDQETENQIKASNLSEPVILSEFERDVINILQDDLPLVNHPFMDFANKLGTDVDRLLDTCNMLLQKGVIRRYGASINHYKAGYKANAMTCWRIPSADIDESAGRIVKFKQVSHCYERETNTRWRYNFYAMVHGRTKSACMEIVNKIHNDNHIDDFEVLFSVKEFKKTRIFYKV